MYASYILPKFVKVHSPAQQIRKRCNNLFCSSSILSLQSFDMNFDLHFLSFKFFDKNCHLNFFSSTFISLVLLIVRDPFRSDFKEALKFKKAFFYFRLLENSLLQQCEGLDFELGQISYVE